MNKSEEILMNHEIIKDETTFTVSLARNLTARPADPYHRLSVGVYGASKEWRADIINHMVENVFSESTKVENKPIVFTFKPWNVQDTDELLVQYFEALYKELNVSNRSETLDTMSEKLKKWSSRIKHGKLLPVVGKYIDEATDLMQTTSNSVKQLANRIKKTSEQRKVIIDILQKLQQKVYVIIDDFDHLNNNQICMIFQLINSTNDFPYMINLLMFDRDVVARALEKEQNCSGYEYLEKIIDELVPFPEANETEIDH